MIFFRGPFLRLRINKISSTRHMSKFDIQIFYVLQFYVLHNFL